MQLLVALALTAQAATAPIRPPELRGEELMRALQSGGYTIVLRHARTDRSYQEAMGTTPVERSAQRNLSAEGVRDAAIMGAVLRKYHIPIGEIISSPMYRARETAEYAAGTPSLTMALRVFPPTEEQASLVKAPAKAGTNRLLVTHHFVIETHVPGIKPGDIAESEAAIVRSTGDGRIELVGRITLGDWERLAGVPMQPAPVAQPTTTSQQASYVPGQSVSLPETHVGELAKRYVDAFNSGDSTRMRAFIESSLTVNPARSTEARLQSYAKSFADFGPFVVTAVKSSAMDEISLGIKARRGDFTLTVKMAHDQPGRAASIVIGTIGGPHP
jgi:phosphohistidine phosphatase SixA